MGYGVCSPACQPPLLVTILNSQLLNSLATANTTTATTKGPRLCASFASARCQPTTGRRCGPPASWAVCLQTTRIPCFGCGVTSRQCLLRTASTIYPQHHTPTSKAGAHTHLAGLHHKREPLAPNDHKGSDSQDNCAATPMRLSVWQVHPALPQQLLLV